MPVNSCQEKAEEIESKEINPICSFPTLNIGDKVIVGFREDKIRERLNL
jgi:hypothetical protein